MELREALEAIGTGHAIYSVEYGEEVCRALGVSCPASIKQVYESDRTPKGVTMYHGPEEGIWSLDLAEHIATCFGVASGTRRFFGRGSQAREYARVVALKLGIEQ